MSWLFGNRLRDEAERIGVPILAARPFETLPARIRAAIADGT